MPGQRVLLPYNFTTYDERALEFVIRTFSTLEEVEVTLFNAYTPLPEVDLNGSPVMDKLKSNLTYLSQKIKEQENWLKLAKQRLVEKGFSEDQVKCIFKPRKKDISSEIIDLVASGGYDLIVINRKPGKVTRFFTGSVLNKVASALKDTVICLVT
ncbi:MAG: universal stress protein [Deltaproteobacteria bacterium]|nr:universal stress protein [Deltaproteobacteria bacterium]